MKFIMGNTQIQNPIKFFVTLNSFTIKMLKNDFLNLYKNGEAENRYSYINIDEDLELVELELLDIDEYGNPITETVYFKQCLEKRLRIEFEKAKESLYSTVVQLKIQKKDIAEFIDYNLKSLIKLQSKEEALIKKYPILNFPINGLINYLKELLEIDNASIIETEEDIVLEIFGFLKWTNQYGQKIMSDSNYNRLINGIREMIETEKAPIIDKLPKINIPGDLLRYCFYVLHMRLYSIKPQREYFITFLKDSFTNFSNMEKSVLTRKFSVLPHIKDASYIPEIVKNTINKKLKKIK